LGAGKEGPEDRTMRDRSKRHEESATPMTTDPPRREVGESVPKPNTTENEKNNDKEERFPEEIDDEEITKKLDAKINVMEEQWEKTKIMIQECGGMRKK